MRKAKRWSESLYTRAVEFHGHGGPFMVVGLRMGLLALRELGSDGWFGLKCRVRLSLFPPDSCVVDGLQSSTGCTMGKGNIDVEEGEGVSAEFVSQGKSLKVWLRPIVFEEIRSGLRVIRDGLGATGIKNELESRLINISDSDLFEIERNVATYVQDNSLV